MSSSVTAFGKKRTHNKISGQGGRVRTAHKETMLNICIGFRPRSMVTNDYFINIEAVMDYYY